ncbi:MAG: Wzz/FepE/Etk N-terminal domain-containing protein [Bacteroidales bacterium]|nr:Wzz/FepE/Etk N-terminal domain-containing protein [Bacteroidales bacterium]
MQDQTNYNFNSMDIIRFMFKHKWPIIIVTLIAAIASIIASMAITPKFKSSVIFYPKTQVSVSHALTTYELINPDMHIMNFGDEEEAEQLIQTLQSEEIRLSIIDKFDLLNHYEIDPNSDFPMTRLHSEMSDNIKFKKTDYQAVQIDVMDTDPVMAANIANKIASLLDQTLNKMQNDVAIEILKVVEAEHNQLLQEIEQIENEMLAQKNKRTEPKYISLGEQLINENKRLSVLKSKLVEARVNSNQNLPRKFLVAKAYPAEKKSYPVRWLIVVVSTISAFIFSILMMLFIVSYKDLLTFK